MICRRLRLIAGSERKKRLHPRLLRGIELGNDVRDKDDLVRSETQRGSDAAITVRLSFLANVRIEVIVDKPREIACVSVREEKLLGQHAAG